MFSNGSLRSHSVTGGARIPLAKGTESCSWLHVLVGGKSQSYAQVTFALQFRVSLCQSLADCGSLCVLNSFLLFHPLTLSLKGSCVKVPGTCPGAPGGGAGTMEKARDSSRTLEVCSGLGQGCQRATDCAGKAMEAHRIVPEDWGRGVVTEPKVLAGKPRPPAALCCCAQFPRSLPKWVGPVVLRHRCTTLPQEAGSSPESPLTCTPFPK